MRSLIVEDDFTARRLMQIYLASFGECAVAINGVEAINAVNQAFEDDNPYDLICLDIMMPEMDGVTALDHIRRIEKQNGINGLSCAKVIMTTAKDQPDDIFGAFKTGCEAYMIKPIRKPELIEEIRNLGLLQDLPTS